MKTLHKNNFYCWSLFDQDRNIDFHSYVWVSEVGVVVFDPLPMTKHDKNHLASLGELAHIFISNSDHVRNAEQLAAETGAVIWGPEAEKENFEIECTKWLGDSDSIIPGIKSYSLNGSKTKGELAFLVEGDTLITGDLIRAHSGGKLCILPDAKLQNKGAAIESVKALASISALEAVLTGDGWPVFRNASLVMSELAATLNQ